MFKIKYWKYILAILLLLNLIFAMPLLYVHLAEKSDDYDLHLKKGEYTLYVHEDSSTVTIITNQKGFYQDN